MRRSVKLIAIGVPAAIVGVLLFTVQVCQLLVPFEGGVEVCLTYGSILPIPGVFLTVVGVLMIGAGLYLRFGGET